MDMEKGKNRGWPVGVGVIASDDFDRMGITADGKLYWDGHPVVTQRALHPFERFLALLAILSTVLIAILEFGRIVLHWSAGAS